MIVQNTGMNQIALPARHVSDDVPKVAADGLKQQAPAQEMPTQQPSVQQLQKAVGAINRAMKLSNHSLEFSVDPDTKQAVVQVMDTETGELIRQIPSKEALAIASSIDQFLQRGVLLKQKA